VTLIVFPTTSTIAASPASNLNASSCGSSALSVPSTRVLMSARSTPIPTAKPPLPSRKTTASASPLEVESPLEVTSMLPCSDSIVVPLPTVVCAVSFVTPTASETAHSTLLSPLSRESFVFAPERVVLSDLLSVSLLTFASVPAVTCVVPLSSTVAVVSA
jgi:hypothetical protein